MKDISLTCTTPTCVAAASEMLANLSPKYKTMDACADFDEFTCGGFRTRTVLRPDQGSAATRNVVGDEVKSILRGILNSTYPGTGDSSSLDRQDFDMLKGAYDSCMNQTAIQAEGITPLMNLLDELAASANGSDYAGQMAYMGKNLFMTPILNLFVEPDDRNPDLQVIKVQVGEAFGLPSAEYYKENETVAEYQKVMARVLGRLSQNKTRFGNSSELAADILKLEMKMAALAPSSEDMQDPSKQYNAMTLEDTSKLIPSLGLDRVLKSLAPSNYTVSEVIVGLPAVISSMAAVLSSSRPETVRGFFSWYLIRNYGTYLDHAPQMQPWLRFSNVLAGSDPNHTPERYRTCISHVIAADTGLGWILSRFFVDVAFPGEAKRTGDQIVSDVKKVYIKKFQGLEWMDDEVKKVAIEKVGSLEQKIGYPDQSPNILDPAQLHAYYAPLSITPSYFTNTLSLNRFGAARMWAALARPTDRRIWEMTAAYVNADYNAPRNDLTFPAAILQRPYFAAALPAYLNYGAFGVVAGHELSHAFDSHGRLYDARGALRDWWTPRTAAAFALRAECMVEQYGNYTVSAGVGANATVLHVNGAQTLAENMADSAGLQAAFEAWKMRAAAEGEGGGKGNTELHMPGLEFFTQDQLFFLAYGNLWCAKYTPAALTRRVRVDEHAPDMIRNTGPVANSRGFREAFGCQQREPTCELY